MQVDDLALELLKELIPIDSENGPDGGAFEADVADYLGGHLRASGIEFERYESKPRRVNIVARIRGASSKWLFLNGHTDTKPAGTGWTYPPFEATVVGTRIYGLGSTDMKGGVAAMLAALMVLQKSGQTPPRNIEVQFVADEEMVSEFGTRFLIERGHVTRRDAVAIIGEPSEAALVERSLGNLWRTVRVFGRRGHPGSYTKALNAIDVCTEIATELRRSIAAERDPADPDFGDFPNCNVGVIRADGHPGTVPGYCEMTFDIRFAVEAARDRYIALIDSILRAAEARTGCRCEVAVYSGGGIPAWDSATKRPPDIAALASAMDRASVDAAGAALPRAVFRGGSDAGWLSKMLGIPPVILGPGSLSCAHAPDEFVEMDEVRRIAKVYLGVMGGFA